MRAFQRWGKELGDRVAGGGKLPHEHAPFGRVPVRVPVQVRIRVRGVERYGLKRDHLPVGRSFDMNMQVSIVGVARFIRFFSLHE